MKVKVYVWEVSGERDTQTFLSKKEAQDYNTFNLAGWGRIEKKVKSATLVKKK